MIINSDAFQYRARTRIAPEHSTLQQIFTQLSARGPRAEGSKARVQTQQREQPARHFREPLKLSTEQGTLKLVINRFYHQLADY